MVRDLACPPADTAFECTKRQEKEDLQKIEEDDDAHAMVRLAVCYLQNEREDDAVDLLEKAAIHGNPEAKNNLAILYANGQGLEQDVEMARQLYEESAEGGCRDAMHNLGIMHDTGRGHGRIHVDGVVRGKPARLADPREHGGHGLVLAAQACGAGTLLRILT